MQSETSIARLENQVGGHLLICGESRKMKRLYMHAHLRRRVENCSNMHVSFLHSVLGG